MSRQGTRRLFGGPLLSLVTLLGLMLGVLAQQPAVAQGQSVASISLNPTSIYGGHTTELTIILTGPVRGSQSFPASSSDPSVQQVPSTFVFGNGASQGTFPLTNAANVTQSKTVTITVGGKTAVLTVLPMQVVALSVNPSVVHGGDVSDLTV